MTERTTVAKLEKLVKDGFENVENSFKALNEKNNSITEDLLEIKNHIIQGLIDANRDLQARLKILEDKLQTHDNILHNHNLIIESNNQYHRRNNLEIAGIPNDVSDEDLEDKTIKLFKKINVDVTKDNVEACHRLPAKDGKNKKVIVRFNNRKFASQILRNKKLLSDSNLDDLNLNPCSVFISPNLNKYFQLIGYECRELKRKKLIHSYKFQNEAFFIKITKDSQSFKKITNVDLLYEKFPVLCSA